MRSLIIVLLRTAKKYTENYNTRAQPLFSSLNLFICDVTVVVLINSLLNLLAEVCFFTRSFAVYLGMIFFHFLGILSDCNLKLQAINVTLQQDVNDLHENLNKLQYKQPASDVELQKKVSENEQIKANAENCEGKSAV